MASMHRHHDSEYKRVDIFRTIPPGVIINSPGDRAAPVLIIYQLSCANICTIVFLAKSDFLPIFFLNLFSMLINLQWKSVTVSVMTYGPALHVNELSMSIRAYLLFYSFQFHIASRRERGGFGRDTKIQPKTHSYAIV